MRRLFLALALVALALPMISLAACNSGGCNANALPTVTLRPPLLIDHEAPTVAGERMRVQYAPVYAAPSWQAIQSPNSCAPAYTVPGCSGGGGTGAPESIPAVRR